MLGSVEVSEERGVVCEVGLDLLETGLEPALQPALGELVLDLVEVALVHDEMIGTDAVDINGPFGLTWRGEAPIADQPAGRERAAGCGRARGRGRTPRNRRARARGGRGCGCTRARNGRRDARRGRRGRLD